MIFKNNNVEVSIDATTGAIVIKHNNGAVLEVIANGAGIKVLSDDPIKALVHNHKYSLAVLITKD